MTTTSERPLIIDSHAHLGACRISGHDTSLEAVLTAMDENGVDMSLCLPFPGPPDNVGVHNMIADAVQKYPDRIRGIASLTPLMDDDEYEREITRCIRDLGFVAIKLHPMFHSCPPQSPLADKTFRLARELGVPVLSHTGMGIPHALPGMLIGRAREFPDVKIVMCHAGAYVMTEEAIIVAENYDNVYLETSWCAPHRIRHAIESLGAHRVMMGADSPEAVADQLAKYRSIAISDEDRAMSLGGTATTVFQL